MSASTPIPSSSTLLGKYLDKNGRFPAVSLQVQPIDPSRKPIIITQFEEYSFQNSVLIPVDSFSFTARNPDLSGSLYDFIQDGDIAVLMANGQPIATGLIDSVTIGTDPDAGERVTIQGRTLIAQLEDQSAINEVDKPFWGNAVTPEAVIDALIQSTRINFYRLQQVPTPKPLLFATEPGESKLSALLRYLEPINCLSWMDPDGTVVIGRPDMGSAPLGTFVMDRDNRQANCLSMQAHYASTQIPNVIVPIWTGQETTTDRVSPEQRVYNKAIGPARLFRFKHRVPRSVVVSTPNGADPQSLSGANQIIVAGSNILQAYAKREIARANINEVGVQVNVQGHYNANLQPLIADTCYMINYPRSSLNEKMYLHTVSYSLNKSNGQRTSLSFCRLGAIVADISVASQKAASKKTQTSSGGTT